MKLSTPTMIVFWIATVLAVLGLLSQFGVFSFAPAFWLAFVGFALLWLGNVLKGF